MKIRLAVQQKSIRRIERNRANAEFSFHSVNDFAADFNRRDEFVKFWIFGRPEFRRMCNCRCSATSNIYIRGEDKDFVRSLREAYRLYLQLFCRSGAMISHFTFAPTLDSAQILQLSFEYELRTIARHIV